MINIQSDSPHDSFAKLLHACDEVLQNSSENVSDWKSKVPPEWHSRMQVSLDCLRQIRGMWNKPNSDAKEGASEPVSRSTFGRFELNRELGKGGFGIVYHAIDTQLGREIALKLPHVETLTNQHHYQRFMQEAHAAARLEHPHIVSVFESGDVAGVPYIASAYCAGISLAEWIRQNGSCSVREVATFLAQLADAIHHAHLRGVLHRDLKPSNILLVEDATANDTKLHKLNEYVPKIADFGLAKLLVVDGDAEITMSGVIAGTAGYMSPEQAEGRSKDISIASDVYSLGAIMYELLAGKPPFVGDTPLAILDQVRRVEPQPLRLLRPNIPRDLQTICLKCLHKKPEQRYITALELKQDLTNYLENKPIRARRSGLAELSAKWVRRHPIISAATLAGLLVAIIALSVAVALISRERDAYEKQRDVALKRRDDAMVAFEMLDRFEYEWISRQTNLEESTRKVFDAKTEFYEQLVRDPDIQPDIKYKFVRAMDNKADTYRRHKDYKRSEALLKRAQSLLPIQGLSEERQTHILADVHWTYGALARDLNRWTEAEEHYLLARDGFRSCWELNPSKDDHARMHLAAMNNVALVYRVQGKTDLSILSMQEALALNEKWAKERPKDAAIQTNLVGTIVNIAIFQKETRRYSDALTSYQKAERLCHRITDKTSLPMRNAEYLIHLGMADLLILQNKENAADEQFRTAADLSQAIAKDYSKSPIHQANYANVLINWGAGYIRSKQPARALEKFRECMNLLTSNLDAMKLPEVCRQPWLDVSIQLAMYSPRGELPYRKSILERAINCAHCWHSENPKDKPYVVHLAKLHILWTQYLSNVGLHAEAKEYYHSHKQQMYLLSNFERNFETNAILYHELAGTMLDLKDSDAALRCFSLVRDNTQQLLKLSPDDVTLKMRQENTIGQIQKLANDKRGAATNK